MRFHEAPEGAILVVGYTAEGPVLAKKLAQQINNGHVTFNAHWVGEQGELRGVCIIMEDQDVEVFRTDDASLDASKLVKSERGTSKRSRGRSTDRGVPAASSDSSGESVG